jgi:hypothetical protein
MTLNRIVALLVFVLVALVFDTSLLASSPLIVGMAISVGDFTQARRNYFSFIASNDAASYKLAYAYFSWLAQMNNSPDLQVVPFTYLTGTDKVIADAPCRLYLILLKKNTTTAAYFKGSDHASVSSSTAPEIEFRQNAVQVDQMFFPKGLAMAVGLTVSSDTTSDGSTGSSAGDGAAGVVVLGRP